MIRYNSSERLQKVICWTGLNTSAFAMQVGLPSPQSLYQIKAGKHQLSRQIAERICERYPEVSFSWLFAGEGEMLHPRSHPIAYYYIDCTEVVLANELPTPVGHITLEGCGGDGVSFVAPCNSQAMEPEIKPGSLLFCKECDPSGLHAGNICLLATTQAAMVRKVLEVTDTHISLAAIGAPDLRPEIVELTLIKSLFRVVAVMEWKSF